MKRTTGTAVLCLIFFWIVFCGPPLKAETETSGPVAEQWAQWAQRTVSRLNIHIMGPKENLSYWADMAATLIEMTEGDPFSPDRLERSLKYLKQCGRFAGVAVDVTPADDSLELDFMLTVKRVIRNIDVDIHGHDGIFKRDVLNVMTVYPGDTWSGSQTDTQKTAVEELLKAAGFPDPVVEIGAIDRDDYTVVLRVDVTLGDGPVIKGIRLSGNRAYSDWRLKARMKTWRAYFFFGEPERFVQGRLESDLKSLVRFYRSKGFAEVTAAYDLTHEPEDNGVIIDVRLMEGPKYEIEIKGNNRFSDRTLRKDLAIYSRGNINGMGIRKSVKNIKDRYRRAGYGEVAVTVNETVEDTDDGLFRRVRLAVAEGDPAQVRSVTVQGNRHMSTEKIKQQMLTDTGSWLTPGVYVPEVLEADIQAIRHLYHENGFYHVQVDKTVSVDAADGSLADITIDINEGDPVRVSSVGFEGLENISENKALKALELKPPDLLDEEAVRLDKINLAAMISEKGYPHVTVTSAVDIGGDGRKADIVYQVDQGPPVKMGKVFVSGNLRTRQSVIRREMELNSGDPFSLTKMIESQQNLRSLNIFRSVDFTPVGLREKDDRVHLFIQTIEKKPYFIELSGGYNSAQGAVGKMKVGDHNLFGDNRDGLLSVELSEIGYRGELRLRVPRIFTTRATAVSNLYMEKVESFNQDFGLKTRGASIGINRQYTPALSAGINLNAERREQYALSASTDSGDENYGSRNTVAVTPGLVYDIRDNGIMPKQGLLATGDVTFSDEISGDQDDFIKYQGSVRLYRTYYDKYTLAVMARAGYIQPTASSEAISDDQLFYLGGISTVRGYGENQLVRDESGDPVGGRLSLTGSVELRRAIKETLSVIMFYDLGKLDRLDAPADSGIRRSIGLGLGYQTPVGPLSLYYGFKLDRKTGEDPGRFHFSIGYTF